MNLSKEWEAWIKAQDKKEVKKTLKTVGKVALITAGGVGCFVLGGKLTEYRIAYGLADIFSNYPDVEKAIFDAYDDFCSKK